MFLLPHLKGITFGKYLYEDDLANHYDEKVYAG